jgi:hypothetical protein
VHEHLTQHASKRGTVLISHDDAKAFGIALNFQKLSCAICCVRFIKFSSSKTLEMLVEKFIARTIHLQEQKVNEPCHAALFRSPV